MDIALRPAMLAAALLAGLAACGGGGVGISRDEPLPFGELWVPTDLQLADVDGNGRQDVLAISMRSRTIAERRGELMVRLQTGPGVFAAAQILPVGVYPWKMAVADIDGDGALDVVVADAGQTGGSGGQGLWLVRQSSTPGNFLPAVRLLDLAAVPGDLAVGDLDGDGAPDIVVTTADGATLLPQDGVRRGSFRAPVALPVPGVGANGVAVGDLDGDGRMDLVVRTDQSVSAGRASTVLGVLRGQAGGTLAAFQPLPSDADGLNSRLMRLHDANADGRMDVLEFLRPCCADVKAEVRVLLQQADGSFARASTSLASVRGIDGAAFADLDGNALIDLATAGFFPTGPSQAESRADVLMQGGSGAFALSQVITLPLSASAIAVGELTGDDHRPDLLLLLDQHRLLLVPQSGTAPGAFLGARTLD